MIFLALLTIAQPVAAQDAGSQPAIRYALDCENATTQTDMNLCSVKEYNRADAALNVEWRKARDFARMRDLYAKLLAAQRAWLSFRDAHCEAVGAVYAGGSIRPLIQNNCMTELTERRTAQLHEMSENN